MKRNWLYFLVFSLFLYSCGGYTDSSQRKFITVSILPQKYLVEQITGESYEINVMIPPGASPVTYDPSPKQLKFLGNSEAYIKIGYLVFEKTWMPKITSANPQLKVYDQSANVNLIIDGEHEDHGHGDHQHAHGGVDPHIWTSPKSVRKQMQSILEYIVELDPENETVYRKNYHEFVTKIDSLDQYMEEQFKGIANRSFLIFHPALSYMARDYGLNQIPVEIEGKEPSPQKLKEIVEKAKKNKIRTILVQQQFSIDNAQTIAREINGRVIPINPLEYNWMEGMGSITDKLVKVMKN